MRSMDSYSKAAVERAVKTQEVILRAMAKKITWCQAAEIIGISDRQMQPTMSCSASACDMPTFRAKTIPFTREMSTSDGIPAIIGEESPSRR